MLPRPVRLAALSVAVFALSTELLLQAASWLAPRLLLADPGDAARAAVTLLAVGDSHTYGAGVERGDDYPSQLEAALRERHPGADLRVRNHGVPGVNSAYVANRLESQIARYRPDLVLVWAGTNNRWNALETEAWGEAGAASRIHRALLHVKLYRLARVAWLSAGSPASDEAVRGRFGFRVGDETVLPERRSATLSDAELAPGLHFDMERMVRTARAFDVPIVFVTYPRETQEGATRAILAAARQLRVPVVDARESFARARRDGHRIGDLIVMAAGPHPTRTLYGYVVEDLLAPVEQALAPRLGDGPAAPRQRAGNPDPRR